MFQYRQVLVQLRQGDSDRDIARSGLMGRPKVARFRLLAESQGWLAGAAPLPEDAAIASVIAAPRRARSTISSVEPFRSLVERWVDQGVGGVAIHAAVARTRIPRQLFLGTPDARRDPRECSADSDRAALFCARRCRSSGFWRRSFLVRSGAPSAASDVGVRHVLCFSRHQYVEFVFDQSVATWLGLHRRAFEWFGKVPLRLIIDNPKCAITRACSRDPLVQRAYAECAEGYRFKIDPCPPADPAKKGIVESGVKYLKGNFLPIRAFRDLADLNAQARCWVMQEAGGRIHGTSREQPLDRFALERPLMQDLPAIAPDLGTWHRVILHRDCHVKFDYSLYSAPFGLVTQSLWLRATDLTVSIFQDYRQVASHLRCRQPGGRRSSPDHMPPEARAFFAHDRDWCLAQAADVGTSCRALIKHLLSDRIVERLRGAQSILRLGNTYGTARLEAACRRALSHASPFYRTVKTILAGGFDLQPAAMHGDKDFVYGRDARFGRDAKTLFTTDLDADEATRH